MNRQASFAVASGLLSLAVVHLAYWLNVHSGGIDAALVCNPYLDGCVSTSRAVRSGPGLLWFKAVMLPVALLMGVTWRSVSAGMATAGNDTHLLRGWTLALGTGGAVALVFYVLFLGSEGALYSWLRKYGVVFFFGFTALAQLLTARFLWTRPGGRGSVWPTVFLALVSLQWAIGVFSVAKRFIFDDPEFIDRVENVTEWWMISLMSLGLVVIGIQLTSPRSGRKVVGPAEFRDS